MNVADGLRELLALRAAEPLAPWIRPWGANYIHSAFDGDDILGKQATLDMLVAAANWLATEGEAALAAMELGAAWAEVEGALPGWRVAMVNLDGDRETGYKWLAVAENGVDDWKSNGYRNKHGDGPSPAAALRALAAALRADAGKQ